MVLIGLVVGVPILLFGPVVEILRSLIAIAAPLALVLMGAVRYVKRLLVERSIGCAQSLMLLDLLGGQKSCVCLEF